MNYGDDVGLVVFFDGLRLSLKDATKLSRLTLWIRTTQIEICYYLEDENVLGDGRRLVGHMPFLCGLDGGCGRGACSSNFIRLPLFFKKAQ